MSFTEFYIYIKFLDLKIKTDSVDIPRLRNMKEFLKFSLVKCYCKHMKTPLVYWALNFQC